MDGGWVGCPSIGLGVKRAGSTREVGSRLGYPEDLGKVIFVS